ncbi:hypothetical protein A2U01_0012658, partial [Trifolium medium]|nr:hypothetical protein [Trifolium medium]
TDEAPAAVGGGRRGGAVTGALKHKNNPFLPINFLSSFQFQTPKSQNLTPKTGSGQRKTMKIFYPFSVLFRSVLVLGFDSSGLFLVLIRPVCVLFFTDPCDCFISLGFVPSLDSDSQDALSVLDFSKRK